MTQLDSETKIFELTEPTGAPGHPRVVATLYFDAISQRYSVTGLDGSDHVFLTASELQQVAEAAQQDAMRRDTAPVAG